MQSIREGAPKLAQWLTKLAKLAGTDRQDAVDAYIAVASHDVIRKLGTGWLFWDGKTGSFVWTEKESEVH